MYSNQIKGYSKNLFPYLICKALLQIVLNKVTQKNTLASVMGAGLLNAGVMDAYFSYSFPSLSISVEQANHMRCNVYLNIRWKHMRMIISNVNKDAKEGVKGGGRSVDYETINENCVHDLNMRCKH